MARILLWFVFYLTGTKSQPTACTEDSHCSAGFYCEEGAHFCRECLHCDELKRESLLPRDVCVKSVFECGTCLKGLVQTTFADGESGTCSPPGSGSAAILPSYGWAAVAASFLLILAILCVLARTRTFKVSYLSRTSVQSLQPAGPAPNAPPPPPYHEIDPPTRQSLHGLASDYAAETNRLIGLPQKNVKLLPAEAPERSREVAGNQAARVYNNPAYVRLPQNISRYDTPEVPFSIEHVSENIDPNTRPVTQTTELNNGLKVNESLEVHEKKSNADALSASQQKNLHRVQDSNNNSSASSQDSQGPSRRGEAGAGPGATFTANLLSGPSIVINVVENISNVQQRNDVTF